MAKADAEFTTGKHVRIPKALRDDLEAAIQAHLTAVEKLTAVLDKADGDENQEDGGDDEPSLLGCSGIEHCDAELDDADLEPSLAHGNDMNQHTARWNLHTDNLHPEVWSASGDYEAEHDGREVTGVDE